MASTNEATIPLGRHVGDNANTQSRIMRTNSTRI